MSGMVQGISVSASVFTLVAIAVDRYGGCCVPLLLHAINSTFPFPCIILELRLLESVGAKENTQATDSKVQFKSFSDFSSMSHSLLL